MLFNSLTFLLFFVGVYALYRALPSWSGKKMLLLVASYCFYAAWSPPYVLLLLASTVLDWWLARRIGASDRQPVRRALLALSLACNLAFLGYFKYGDFLLENFSLLLANAGIHYQPLKSAIILPVGISFYTFASLSYTIDVYRREIRSDWRLADYALFVSFFPHLVAGPIVRASCLLPQIVSPRTPNANQVGWGMTLLIFGLFCKSVIADNLFAPVVNHFYATPSLFSAIDAWPAVLGFSGQIYYDFCGYTLCAIGLALMFGFSFPDNFHHPYAARSFSDFWRRWHISLSSWLRDYVYISFGGNRHGTAVMLAALLATMLLGGLWHGASWLFILWGGLHGIYLVLERLCRRAFAGRAPGFLKYYGPVEVLVFAVVTLTWIPFRAASVADAWSVAHSLFRPTTFLSGFGTREMLVVAAMLVTVIWHIFLRDRTFEQVAQKCGPAALGLTLTTCLMGLFLFSGGDEHAFIYFQF